MNKVSENPFKNRRESTMPLMAVTALFVTLYLVSNIMAVKVISIAGWLVLFRRWYNHFPLCLYVGRCPH